MGHPLTPVHLGSQAALSAAGAQGGRALGRWVRLGRRAGEDPPGPRREGQVPVAGAAAGGTGGPERWAGSHEP